MRSRTSASFSRVASPPTAPLRLLLALVFIAACIAPTGSAEARWRKRQQALGAVNAGHLQHAARLHNTRYVKLRFPNNAWGTRRMVDVLQQCAKQVGKRHRSAHKLLVGDLSRRKGGPLPPHAGHQNGREADVGFYMRSGKPLAGLWKVGAYHIDAKRTLTFLSCLIGTGDVLNIFMARALQPPLVREAKRRRWTKARIAKTFSWPRGRNKRVGIIQHRGGHDNHLHVRLKCARHEKKCRNKPVARRHALRAKRRHRHARRK